MKRACLVSVLLAGVAPGAAAADTLKATLQWSSEQLQMLAFSRAGKGFVPASGKVTLTFSDPRRKGETKRILLDASYRPGTEEAADFFARTTIVSPATRKTISESGLCYWNADKSLATCSIEDDGGRFLIRVLKRADTLAKSRFEFLIRKTDGYAGFRIASEESDEPVAIDVKLRQGPVATAITF